MAIQLLLEDYIGNRRLEVKIEETVPIAQLIPAIITTLGLSNTDSAGRPITYHLSYADRRLQENETLEEADVHPGDTITIVPNFLRSVSPDVTGSVHDYTLQLMLEDARGGIRYQVKVSANTPVEWLIPVIITKLGLSVTDSAGRPITYRLSHRNRRLQENETLEEANVLTGDTITIVPEMIAGPFTTFGYDYQDELPIDVPPGFRLRYTLWGHKIKIDQIAWSPDGKMLASLSRDGIIQLWNTETGKLYRTLIGYTRDFTSLAWSPTGEMLASGCVDEAILLWDVKTGRHLRTLAEDTGGVTSIGLQNVSRTLAKQAKGVTSVAWSSGGELLASSTGNSIWIWDVEAGQPLQTLTDHFEEVTSVAWSPDGEMLASSSSDQSVKLWDVTTWQIRHELIGHTGNVTSVAWSPSGQILASSSNDYTIRLWDAKDGRQKRVLQGHTEMVTCTSFSSDGRFLASQSHKGTILLWRTDIWQTVAVFSESPSLVPGWVTNLAFHPKAFVLATSGEQVIHIWDLDLNAIFGNALAISSVNYVNAKVVLVGDTGVGKSGLNLVLTGRPFTATDSTDARNVWLFDSREVELGEGRTETHEIFLWDLAGQPGYRLIHQLYLREMAVALVVFDARSETDPFAGVQYWDRALRRLQTESSLPLKKFLVAARTDRGGRGASRQRIQSLVSDLGFDGYFETSAKEGRNIAALAEAIRQAVDWGGLPKVSSTGLFQRIRKFLETEKETARPLSMVGDLYRAFLVSGNTVGEIDDLFRHFEVCIRLIESQDLIRKLSFGNLVLLQPELLDFYASALVNAVKDEPDGLGSIAEARVSMADFYIPPEKRLQNREEEKLLLLAMIEELLIHEIALREQARDGAYLIFPSQSTRENPDLPDPEGKAVVFSFEGPVQNIYATLAVRLSHSGVFERKELWKNAVTYTASVGGTYGIFLENLGEGQGRLTLFFNATSEEMCFLFEDFIHKYLKDKVQPESILRQRVFVCAYCGSIMTDQIAQRRVARGFKSLNCPVCGDEISLLDGEERLTVVIPSRVQEMGYTADNQRDREVNASVLQGKIATGQFDVFLCHNGEDKPLVKEIGERLKERGILPWLDEWELRPGLPWQRLLEQQIGQIKAAAVFIGKNGIGPWEHQELDAFLREYVRRGCPVIPVLLEDAPKEPAVPPFLRNNTWVDFRKPIPDPLDRLIWGITGERI